jgi:hypothetical protein
MTQIDGVAEIVDSPKVFDLRHGSSKDIFVRGIRNFHDRLTLTVFGAAVFVGSAVAAPLPSTGETSFHEPAPVSEADARWKSSVAQMSSLISDMKNTRPSSFAAQLFPIATIALASLERRKGDDTLEWAKALASEDGDLDD